MADFIPWVATVATIIAASMTAANLGTRITGYGFAVFLVGSLAWLAAGLMTRPAGADLDQCRPHRPQHLRHLALAWAPGSGRGRCQVGERGERGGCQRNPVPGLAASEGAGAEGKPRAWPLRGRHGGLLQRKAELRRRLDGRSSGRRGDPAPLALEPGPCRRRRAGCRVAPGAFERLDELPRDQWPAR